MRRFHRSESGAIALLLLAGALILMMMAWVIYDSGEAARQKIKVQSAADMSVSSQVAVKARAMNMMAYSNVAKRSIFAIHATYISHFLAYIKWAGILYSAGIALIDFGADDVGTELASTGDVWIQWWMDEARGDFKAFSNVDLLTEEGLTDAHDFKINIGTEILDSIDNDNWATQFGAKITTATLSKYAFPADSKPWAGYSLRYHAQDIKALDNYQRYLAGVTPWWAWSEHLVRGLRNGATATGSFPLPYTFNDGLPDILGQIASSLGDSTAPGSTPVADTLPIRPGDGGLFHGTGAPGGRQNMADVVKDQLAGADVVSMVKQLFDNGTPDFENLSDTVFFVEHLVNILAATLASDYPVVRLSDNAGVIVQAIVQAVTKVLFPVVVGVSTHNIFINEGLDFTQKLFDKELGTASASPWVLLRYPTQAEWLLKTSNIVFAYHSRHQLFGEDRTKFDVPGKEYAIVDPITGQGGFLGSIGRTIYRTSGYWGMARAEIYYNADAQPGLWNPVWNARLRPVSLAHEFEDASYSLAEAYHQVVLSMAVMANLNISDFDPIQVLGDFIQMERNVRAMAPVTAAGVVK